MAEEKKKFKSPLVQMVPISINSQGIKQIDDALEEKKLTPEQKNILLQMKDKLRFESRRLYPRERVGNE